MCQSINVTSELEPMPEGKYRVAIILPHFYPYVGGGEKLFYDIAKGLVLEGHEVHVVAEKVDEEHTGYKEVDGIKVWYCNWKSAFGHPFPKRVDIEPHIAWCDVVHSSTYTTSPVVSRLAKKYKKPSLLTVHEVRGPLWFKADTFIKALIFWSVEQYTVRQQFTGYHAVSEATLRDTKRYTGRKNVKRVYLYNEFRPGLESKHFSLRGYFNLPEETKVFLYYGRPGKTKGIDVYKKALLDLKKQADIPDNVKFCFILGKEPADLRKKFIRDIEKADLGEQVLIRDSVARDELASAILQADYIVVPSLTEGFGFSALEACLMGKPLIHSNAGSLPEVCYGQCISFENGDAKELQKGIEAVMKKGLDAFETVEEKHFSYEKMMHGITEFYNDMIEKD